MRWLPIALVLVLLAPAASASWPMFHGNERNTGLGPSSYEVYEDVWWNVPTVASAQVESSPIVDGGIVIIGDWSGTVRALDAASGVKLWEVKMSDRIIGTPAISADRVFVVDTKGALRSLDLRTGTQLASAAVGATQASVTVHQGKLFIGNEAGEMRAYDTQTLTLLWTFKVTAVTTTVSEEGKCGSARHPVGQIRSAPVVYQGKVFFGAFNNYIYAINEEGNPDKSVSVQWIFETNDIVWASPMVDHARGRVVFGSYDQHIYSFAASPSGSGGNPCFGFMNNPTWKYQVPSDFGSAKVHSSPATDGDRIYFGANNGRVYAIQASNGQKVWEYATGREVFSSPAVAGGLVVVGSDDKNVYWLHSHNGTEAKRFATEGSIKTSPAIDGQRAFAASFDGVLYMFGPKIPARPDLVVSSVSGVGSVITVVVSNRGDADAGTTSLRITMAGSFLADLDVPALAAGQQTTLTHVVAAAEEPSPLRAIVDPDNLVVESDESNNERSGTLVPASSNGNGGEERDGIGIPGPGLLPLLLLIAAMFMAIRRRR